VDLLGTREERGGAMGAHGSEEKVGEEIGERERGRQRVVAWGG
jgi:hypothetical protein